MQKKNFLPTNNHKNNILGNNKSSIQKHLNELSLLEYKEYSSTDNYADELDSDFDIVLMFEEEDIFDKKQIKLKYDGILGNLTIINRYPNALLIEDFDFDKKKFISKNTDNGAKDHNDYIWDIIDKMKNENHSESLDNLTTESSETEKKNIEIHNNQCKGCKQKETLVQDHHTSYIVCSMCGIINEQLFDYGPEWRQYYNDDNRGEGINRCGCPSNFFFPKSSQGTIMTGTNNSRLKRKQKWNSMIYKERSLNQVFEYITSICSKNHIPKIIIDTAKILYKKISDCKHKTGSNMGKQIIIRGKNRMSIIAACVFKACEMNNSPRSIKEIAKYFLLDEKKITKGNKQFEKIMKNADDKYIDTDYFNSHTAEDYIRRHCSKLKINKSETDMAIIIARNCCRMKLVSDHNPQSIAAGSILLMLHFLNKNIDRKNIAIIFGTSEVTINKIYHKLIPYLDALVDDAATTYIIRKFKING
jgi:transcription initiation factor TFIIIB Brf1 subunit/transcription initiation factor TFIIB